MDIKIVRSNKLNKLQHLHTEAYHVIENLTDKEWQLLYRRLGHFNGNELMVKLDVDTFCRLGEEDYIPYAILSVDGQKPIYVITSFDVYNYKRLMATEERTSAFMLDKSKILRAFCQGILANNSEDLFYYNIELDEHIERELNYQTKNKIEVPLSDPILV